MSKAAAAKVQAQVVVSSISRLDYKLRSNACCHLAQRILIPAGKAAPTPPVGPALGARGVKSMDFCKEFNARTAHIEPGVPTPTLITVQPDRTFTFITKTPPTTYLLKKAAGIEKGTGKPGHEVVGTVSLKHVYEIAKIKATDAHLKHLRLEAIASTVVATAKTLGVQVVP
jgi:large subunit ribosomal protein L11